MDDWKAVSAARVASGSEFELFNQENDWIVRVNGRLLMSSKMHDSEEALADQALDRVEDAGHVLVGGLGLGFTLRAVLERVAEDAVVTVAELVPELVEWNRGPLAVLHDNALDDPRCSVVVGDVFELIKQSTRVFDVILLDVDNGPAALAQAKNQRLYGENGVRACFDALTPEGVLAVWSSGHDARYERRLSSLGFDVEVIRIAARVGSRARHVLFLAKRRFGHENVSPKWRHKT